MKPKTLFCAMIVAAAFTGNAEAIYKCTTDKGVVYQDRPCREGSESAVRIVVPNGDASARPLGLRDDGGTGYNASAEDRFAGPRAARAASNDSTSANAPGSRKSGSSASAGADRKASTATAATAPDGTRRADAHSSAENATVPMTAEQARKTESSAKYYTIDGVWPAAEIPEQMNCESPSGEKRRFLLSNGKLSSI